MSLDIKELYKSDLDPNYISTWWSTKKVEKLNWNFDRILEAGGGPLGPQGWLGKSGRIGADGAQGANGRQGPVGNRGNQGFSGENDWIENYSAGETNTAILIKQIKDDPYDVKVGYSNMHAAYSSATTHTLSTGSINRWNTRNSSTIFNGVFTSSDIDGSNVDISTRKVYFWNLYRPYDINNPSLIMPNFQSGFRNTPGGRTNFSSNKFIFKTPKYTNDGYGVFSPTTALNLKKHLTLEASQFLLGPDVVSEFGYSATFKATTDSGTLINHKFGPTIYSIPGPRKVAFTHSGAGSGTILWGNAYDVIGGFPIGSIIITQDEFIDAFFHLEESGTVVNKGNVSGFDNPSTTPVIEFKYGAGKLGTKFEGWYLCNGKTWSKGSVSYELPNLCGFDLNVDYDVFGDFTQAEIVANGNINQSTPNKQIQGSAVIKFRARESNSPGSYLFDNGTNSQTEVLESYIDAGEPLEHIYEGAGVNTFDYEDGRNDGLIYLCYLGQDGFKWDTSESQSTIVLETVSLSYNAATIAAACSATAASYKSNFTTAWNDGNYWTTNGNKLYNSAGTDYAPSGYYHSNGIVRYWNYSTVAFSSRDACPSYTSIQLAYNTSATSGSLNGTFSSRTKSTYYINSTALSAATSLYTNASGTSLATAGWYRDGGSRRYWNGTAFEGAVFTEDWVNYLSASGQLGYGSSASGACNGDFAIEPYYEVSSAISKTFSGTSGITNLYISYNTDGTGVINYANSAYYYSDSIVSRKCTSSFTGALGTAASCSFAAPPPSGGGGGGGGGGCVLFGTKIKMSDGTTKMVQDVLIGDSLASKTILNQTYSEKSELYDWSSSNIKLSDSIVRVISNRSINTNTVYSINDGKFFTSADHNHIYKHNNIWKVNKTDNLEVGDSLIDENGNEIIINNIVMMTGQFIVYNIDVDNNNVYIANGVLTHNKEQLEQNVE